MKNFYTLLGLVISLNTLGQSSYWQQHLSYNIDVTLDDKENTVLGKETIIYHNFSPDTLQFLWFHLYPNAYSSRNTSLFRQIENDPARKDKLINATMGSITDLNFTVNQKPLKIQAHPDSEKIDVVKLILPSPLLPGDSVTISTPFKVKLPSYFSRSGYADGEFMICQWYPKPAVYDKAGWHEMPYLDMGEFYSEYADYDVQIHLPSEYVVGATGTLITSGEDSLYKKIGTVNARATDESSLVAYKPLKPGTTKTLHYQAANVPDFAWFADKDFFIQYDTVQLQDHVSDAFTYFFLHDSTPWVKSIDFVKDAVHHYSNWVGEYAYPVVQAVEGPKNNSSGGMEYPMITLITSPDALPETLDGVIAHEVGHNWFMSMLGSNERDHTWMDEGMNTYYQFRYEAEKYRGNSIYGAQLPAQLKKLSEEDFQSTVYNAMLQIPIKPAIETNAADFVNSEDYGLAEYIKAAVWMYMLEKTLGRDEVDKAFQNYFTEWKFKHPQPGDLKNSFEESTGKNLSKFFDLLKKTSSLVE